MSGSASPSGAVTRTSIYFQPARPFRQQYPAQFGKVCRALTGPSRPDCQWFWLVEHQTDREQHYVGVNQGSLEHRHLQFKLSAVMADAGGCRTVLMTTNNDCL